MSVYEWAHYTATKGAVKMHTLLEYDSLLPGFVCITDGKKGDNWAAFGIVIKPHTIVVADRGYCDYGLLGYWDNNGVFFIVRHKRNIRYRKTGELPLPEKGGAVRADRGGDWV